MNGNAEIHLKHIIRIVQLSVICCHTFSKVGDLWDVFPLVMKRISNIFSSVNGKDSGLGEIT